MPWQDSTDGKQTFAPITKQGSGELLLSEPALSCGADAYPWLTQHPAQRPFAVALTNKIVNRRRVPKPIGELRGA